MTAPAIGVMLDTSGMLRAGDVAASARYAEELGLDGVFVGDHLAGLTPSLDATLVLSTAAAATDRIAVGFAVMVPVLRHVAWAAKQVATLQQLSGNRLILGVGSGAPVDGTTAWDALGIPYTEREARTDHALRVLPELIAGHAGEPAMGRSLALAPSAVVPPIWIGGNSPAALRRACEHGDAWFPSMIPGVRVSDGAQMLRQAASRAGRLTPGIVVGGAVLLRTRRSPSSISSFSSRLSDGYGMPHGEAKTVPIIGDTESAAQRFAEYADAGAQYLVLGSIGGDWGRQCELIAEARALLA